MVWSKGILRRTHFVRLLRMTLIGLGCYFLIKCSLLLIFFQAKCPKPRLSPWAKQSVAEGSLRLLLPSIQSGIIQGDPSTHSLRSFAQDDISWVGVKIELLKSKLRCHPVTLSDQRESKGLLGSHYLRFKVVLSKGILRRTHSVRLLRMTLLGLGLYFKHYSIFTQQKIISTTIPSKPLKYIRQALPFIAIIDIWKT